MGQYYEGFRMIALSLGVVGVLLATPVVLANIFDVTRRSRHANRKR